MTIVSFDNLYHKNHINLFTLTAMKNLFAKVGLKVVKENLEMYGMTFLLEKCEPTAITTENWESNLDTLKKHKAAWELCNKGKLKEALAIVPLMPSAWCTYIAQTIGKDRARQNDEWLECLKIPEMQNNAKILMHYAFWLQAEERYIEAISVFTKLFDTKPNADWLFQRGICQSVLKRHDDALESFKRCASMQPLRWAECMDWSAKNACSLPTWEEVGIEQVKREIYEMNKDNIVLKSKDKVMDAK
jgi:tetratricopeptide (TPR) repeat protein